MIVTITPRKLSGTIAAIPSKSHVHRLLICAALGNRPATLPCRVVSQDIEATVRCLRALGQPVTNDFIGPGSLRIYVIQPDGAAYGRFHGQIRHKCPGPSPGAASYVCDPDVIYPFILISHVTYRPFTGVMFLVLCYTGHYR